MTAADKKKRSAPAVAVAPDGGWGWIVVLGVAMSNMTNTSLFSVFGLIFGQTLESWGLETTGVSVISSTMNAVMNFSGVLVGSVIKKFGARSVAFTGGVFVAMGMVLSSVASRPWHILLAWGGLVGLGLGLQFASTFLIVSSYFKTRRGQAVGISLAGTGLGQMLMPHLVRYLLEEYGFHGSVLILGGVALHALPGSLLFRPLSVARRNQGEDEDASEETEPLKPNQTKFYSPEVCETKEVDRPTTSLETSKSSPCRRLLDMMDLDLLCNGSFMILSLGAALFYTANTSFSMILPFLLLESSGLTASETATCMSALSGMDLLSRLVLPTMTVSVSARTVMLLGAFASAASRSLVAEVYGFIGIVTASAICGFCRGATVLNQNLILAEHVSADRLPAALGLAMVVKGIATLSVGSLLGVVRDVSGSYPLFVHTLTALNVFTCFLWVLESAISSRRRRSRT